MKKYLFLHVIIMSLFFGVKAQNDAIYVYRNDGFINAFLKSDIDSICYSQLDLDSVAHSEYVVQEVWTEDSVYRFPLEKIDSVGFVTPETVYKPGTVNITSDMREYIVDFDSLMLTFAFNTPTSLLPHIGDKLVNTEASGGLLSGFIGQVRDIVNAETGYFVYCDAIDLTDVFECYYGMYKGNPESSQPAKTKSIKDGFHYGGFEWNPGKLSNNLISTFGSSISYDPDENNLVPSLDAAEFSLSLTPKIKGSSYLIVNREYGVNFGISIYGDYTLEEYMALAGSVTGGGDLELAEKSFPIPEVLCDIYVEFGTFMRAGFQISTKQKWTQRYKSTFHFEWSSKAMESLKNVNDIRILDNTHSGVVALKGVFEGGLYTKVGLSFITTSELDIAKVGLRLEGGMCFEGTALPYIGNKEDALNSTDLYNMMKGQGVELCTYYGTSIDAKFFPWSLNMPIPNWGNVPFGKKSVIKSSYYVPEFRNTKLENNEEDYFASVDIVGNCGKTDIGFSLQCKDNPTDRVDGYIVYDYNGPSSSAYATFFNKPLNEPYIVYPLVKFGELEMIAEPSAEVAVYYCPDNNHPHAIDLGLPSGTKWSCMNIGAEKPEDYGDYFAWGETEPKNEYVNWSTYKWCNGTYHTMTKYSTYVDDKTVLDLEDDAAYVNWGGNWHMPSYDIINELLTNCTWTYITLSDINGYKVVGPNGNVIFLPAAGSFFYDSNLFNNGISCHYWSSTLYPTDNAHAYFLNGASSGFTGFGGTRRCCGLPVRSVCQ